MRYLPFFSWIKTYSKADFLADLPSGLTLGIMLIPQGMAYAMVAGLPPEYGLYAALMPQLVYMLMGTSRHLAVGPVATDSILVISGLSLLAEVGTEYYIFLAMMLSFMVGAIQIIMGLFRLGFVVNYLSKPVISGFISAAAIIIALGQLKNLLGMDIESSTKAQVILSSFWEQLSTFHILSFAIGVGSLLILFLMKKYLPKWPSALVVVVLGISSAYFWNMGDMGLSIVGDIPSGFPSFIIPFEATAIKKILPTAATLALIAFLEGISIAKALEERHDYYKVDANQELFALGAANFIGSFFQSYPTTGAFSRSAVSDQTGTRTNISALISVLVVALTLLFLTPLFYHLPKAVLGAIIFVSVIGLVATEQFKLLWKNHTLELIPWLATFLVTLLLGITEGIVFGTFVSFIVVILKCSKPKFKSEYKTSSALAMTNQEDSFDENQRLDKEDVLAVSGDIYFGNWNKLSDLLHKHIKAMNGRSVLSIDLTKVEYIDFSSREMLLLFQKLNKERCHIRFAD